MALMVSQKLGLTSLLPDGRKVRSLVLLALLSVTMTGPRAYASQGGPQAEPAAPIHSYITSDDYPSEAITKGEQGTVEFLLTIGVDGRPSDCVVTNSSGSSSLDSASCLIMIDRARFRPATNAAGKPTVSTYQNRISWRLESSRPLQDLGAPPAVLAATGLWYACSSGEAAKLVASELPASKIIAQAFAACAQLEQRIALEMRKAGIKGLDPEKLIPDLKKEVAGKVPQVIDQSRAALKGEVRK